MGIFDKADTGINMHKSFFPMKEKVIADIYAGRLYPLSAEFGVPGDIWHFKNSIFIRAQPMLAPLLTDLNFRMRYFFVPLRLLDSNTELIITGSTNGHYDKTVVIPEFKKMFDDAVTSKAVDKYSVLDYMLGMPIGDYANIYQQDCMPAQYWLKAVERIWFDWYRDENLSSVTDFDTYWADVAKQPGKLMPHYSNWRKDYFTASLPWQQKGIEPSIALDIVNPNNSSSKFPVNITSGTNDYAMGASRLDYAEVLGYVQALDGTAAMGPSAKPLSVNLANAGSHITTTDLRLMTQEQRILERLARCGSRLTEYLKATFGTAPADETLQRAQYLGGFTQPIITSEVMQTGGDSTNPIGTMRGKGISLAQNTLNSFMVKEFGVIIGMAEIMPKATYTQGINRKYTFVDRWSFVNPSFQNLSEQEVRNGEVYINFNNDEGPSSNQNFNDETFAFNEMYSELKTNRDRVCGDMRDNSSYWTMARYFNTRPNLNEAFVTTQGDSLVGPFAVQSAPTFIIECGNLHSVWRCLTRYSTPGLLDHN